MSSKNKSAPKGDPKKAPLKTTPPTALKLKVDLFDRVVGILEQARANVVRAVNSQMVLAYWLIGREIVQEVQGGQGRAAYGQQVLRELSRKLGERYGRGFSVTNLQYFRQFQQVYSDRVPVIHQTASGEWLNTPRPERSAVMVLDDDSVRGEE